MLSRETLLLLMVRSGSVGAGAIWLSLPNIRSERRISAQASLSYVFPMADVWSQANGKVAGEVKVERRSSVTVFPLSYRSAGGYLQTSWIMSL